MNRAPLFFLSFIPAPPSFIPTSLSVIPIFPYVIPAKAGIYPSVIAKHYDFVKHFLNTSDVLIDVL